MRRAGLAVTTSAGEDQHVMTPETSAEELLPEPTLLDVIVDLRRDVAELDYPLNCVDAAQAREAKDRMLGQLDDHLIPRLRELSAPAVVVIAGSTGAGKSTLMNSLLKTEISPASVIRPTTREPVLAYNAADADLMAGSVLNDSVRTVEHDQVPRGLAILDAPDLDSLLASNRETAARMLDAADLWLFVTTAARYGDALPWQALRSARERGASVALVLNRVSKATLGPVRTDLLARLKENDMTGVPLFVIGDVGAHEGMLEPKAVAPVARWLRTLAGADHARTVILRTLRGSLASLAPLVLGLADAVEAQHEAATLILRRVTETVPAGLADFEKALIADDFAAGILEASWTQIVTADPGIAKLSGSRWRRPGRKTVERRNELLSEIVSDVRKVVTAQLETACDVNVSALDSALSGADAPAGGAELFAELDPKHGTLRGEAVQATVRSWVAHVKGTLDEMAQQEATRAAMAHATRGLGAGGLAGLVLVATVGEASAHRILSGLLGPTGPVLVDEFRSDLLERARTLLTQEADPYAEYLNGPTLRSDAVLGLRLRLAELKRAV